MITDRMLQICTLINLKYALCQEGDNKYKFVSHNIPGMAVTNTSNVRMRRTHNILNSNESHFSSPNHWY